PNFHSAVFDFFLFTEQDCRLDLRGVTSPPRPRIGDAQRELRGVAEGEEPIEPRLVMLKLRVILLRDDLRVRLLPGWNAAGVIAMGMSQDDVFDRSRVF